MSLETVRDYFATLGREHELLVTPGSSHTVDQAAAAFGVEPARIAKTLAYKGDTDDTCELIVMAGDVRSDNTLFKTRFGRKASMLKPEVVLALTGHPVGGVCPFANPPGATVWLDTSLQRFETVFPAAGSPDSAIELTLPDLEQTSHAAGWVTVGRLPE
ncbi:YbaK/EbsC family protein [Branchiibius sp. NY16-3462-2]|uniref:YbaK/EbsC family protein n=1 Tax=Branchiibius sp. NY16-3462-2 TaxID=1807500 RepID=UPI00079CAFB6|nr:YbaK/EbsC family protein [Branchiibius sp. NY16-3462-2]KYH45174.1 EBSC protein [Branchiibius sp. NY16-3462-2]